MDEAQFVKNPATKASQNARRFPAPFKLAITGTPMENNLMELWSMFSITAPGLFPSSKNFSDYYRIPVEKEGDPDKLAQLRRRIRPLMMRRTKELVAKDLPAKQEQVLELELAPRHRTIYQRHLQRERQKVLGLLEDMDKNRFAIFKSLTTLRRLSLDASLVDVKYASVPSSRLDALMEQLGDIVAEGHRALIFSQFTGFLRKDAARLDAWLVEYGRRERTHLVPIAKLQQGGPGGLRSKATIEGAMRELDEAGRARWVRDGKRKMMAVNPAPVIGGGAWGPCPRRSANAERGRRRRATRRGGWAPRHRRPAARCGRGTAAP